MMFVNFFYVVGLISVFQLRSLLAYHCYQCNAMHFNYSVTIDNFPLPIRNDCQIVKTDHRWCYVRVGWYDDRTSEVYYSPAPGLPNDSILAMTQRRVKPATSEYTTHRSIAYSCKAENGTPCNTPDQMKRAMIATTFPQAEQIKSFDELIGPFAGFNSSQCFLGSNLTICPETDLQSCKQCMGIAEYAAAMKVCGLCPAAEATANFIDSYTTFALNNRTRFDSVQLGCQKSGPCNSVENIDAIRQRWVHQFDFDRFTSTAASTRHPSVMVICLVRLSITLF